jgi:enoyl-CoA hydratase/carnithine racemase
LNDCDNGRPYVSQGALRTLLRGRGREENTMAEFETVLFDVRNRVATITLNRPERMNAMNQRLEDELRTCWQRVKGDADIWVAIITGAGDAFSSGADVEALASGGFVKPDRWRELAMIESIVALPTPRRQRVHKPIIAAVNGAVAGFSLDLVTESDIPIASERAYFVDPHVSIGYVSSHEMVNMARRVPVAVCLRMALLGSRERMSAQRAYEVGLVTEVVPHGNLMDRAWEIADMLLSNSPLAVWGTKMAILQGLGLPIPQAEEIAAGYLEVVEQSDDHKEGPLAFVEKRTPQWQAR